MTHPLAASKILTQGDIPESLELAAVKNSSRSQLLVCIRIHVYGKYMQLATLALAGRRSICVRAHANSRLIRYSITDLRTLVVNWYVRTVIDSRL